MKYRWVKRGIEWEEVWTLFLILDGKKYGFADVNWYFDTEKWELFVSGFVSETALDIEKEYELLSDAKEAALTYAKVWWITGDMQRKDAEEKRQWHEIGTI